MILVTGAAATGRIRAVCLSVHKIALSFFIDAIFYDGKRKMVRVSFVFGIKGLEAHKIDADLRKRGGNGENLR